MIIFKDPKAYFYYLHWVTNTSYARTDQAWQSILASLDMSKLRESLTQPDKLVYYDHMYMEFDDKFSSIVQTHLMGEVGLLDIKEQIIYKPSVFINLNKLSVSDFHRLTFNLKQYHMADRFEAWGELYERGLL